ncbi:unnamed protein product [Bemisia tabaci]|uniref:Uncharacterized protein n=1 Tax=Bemisia tabaci TaxID=7038 RepID=A0A9P0A4C9_BEMTA|nr:unnamed protein product [Bemisia tabaci]
MATKKSVTISLLLLVSASFVSATETQNSLMDQIKDSLMKYTENLSAPAQDEYKATLEEHKTQNSIMDQINESLKEYTEKLSAPTQDEFKATLEEHKPQKSLMDQINESLKKYTEKLSAPAQDEYKTTLEGYKTKYDNFMAGIETRFGNFMDSVVAEGGHTDQLKELREKATNKIKLHTDQISSTQLNADDSVKESKRKAYYLSKTRH